MKLDDKTYTFLKWVAQLLLPAIATLYFAVASIWGLPYAQQVVGTTTALDAFLGIILGISTSSYDKSGMDGVLQIDKSNPDKDVYRLNINGDLVGLGDKTSVILSVDSKADLSNK